jgi:hypothetical protein
VSLAAALAATVVSSAGATTGLEMFSNSAPLGTGSNTAAVAGGTGQTPRGGRDRYHWNVIVVPGHNLN